MSNRSALAVVRMLVAVTLVVAAARPASAQARTFQWRQNGPMAAPDPMGQISVDGLAIEPVEAGPPVKDAPFSAEAVTEIVQPLIDGNRIVRRTTVTLYRDSRGRTRRETTMDGIAGILAADTPLKLITVTDPEKGMTYTLGPDGQWRVIRMRPGSPAPMASPLRGPGPAPGVPAGVGIGAANANAQREVSLGTRDILGVVCEGTSTTVTIPARAIGNERPIESVSERWFATELKIVLLNQRRDPRFGETTYRVTRLDRAEPVASLFEPALP